MYLKGMFESKKCAFVGHERHRHLIPGGRNTKHGHCHTEGQYLENTYSLLLLPDCCFEVNIFLLASVSPWRADWALRAYCHLHNRVLGLYTFSGFGFQ